MVHEPNARHAVTSKCRLLRSKSQISGGSGGGKCVLCDHLEDLKKSLKKYFKGWLRERNTTSLSSARLQVPVAKANADQLQRQELKLLAKAFLSSLSKKNAASEKGPEYFSSNSDIKQLSSNKCENIEVVPLEKYSHGKTRRLSEADLFRVHSMRRLNNQGKRHSHSTEELQDTKRIKSSPALSEKENKTPVFKTRQRDYDEFMFVHETENSSTQRKFCTSTHQDACIEINSDVQTDLDYQSQHKLLVPDTHIMECSSCSDREDCTHNSSHDIGQQVFVVPETQIMGYSSKPERVDESNQSKHDANQQFFVPETQNLDYLSKLNRAYDVENKKENNDHHMLVIPETQHVGYSSSTSAVKSYKQSDNHQMLVFSEMQSEGYSCNPRSDVKSNKYSDDYQMLDVPETQNMSYLSKVDVENDVVERKKKQ